jgi:phosphoglucomutase
MNAEIKFGTSGWRAVIADKFTFSNLRRAVTGIARYVAAEKPSGARVIVGCDPRYMGERFVATGASGLWASNSGVIWQSWFLLSGKIQLPLDAGCEGEVH